MHRRVIIVVKKALGEVMVSGDVACNAGAEKFKVLAFDNRGVGRTGKPDIAYSIEMMADDTARLMQMLSIQQAHIIGISMGGRIALSLSLRHASKSSFLFPHPLEV